VAIFAAAAWAGTAHGQVADLTFEESPSCRVNEIPLGQPARIEAKRDGAIVDIKVAANFGCGTTAGRAKAQERGGEIELSAVTILPDHPTPACKCTRHLSYRFKARNLGTARIVFLKDGQVAGEGKLD